MPVLVLHKLHDAVPEREIQRFLIADLLLHSSNVGGVVDVIQSLPEVAVACNNLELAQLANEILDTSSAYAVALDRIGNLHDRLLGFGVAGVHVE